MSLKAFHIFFIALASLMTLGCGVWALRMYSAPEPRAWQLWFGIGALLVSCSLMIYGRSFLKKTKNVSYL
jgi:hypothetical protein